MYKDKVSYASGRWKWFKPKVIDNDIKIPQTKILKEVRLPNIDRILRKNRIKLDWEES